MGNCSKVIHLEKSPARVRGKKTKRTFLLIEGETSCNWAVKNKPCTYCGFWKRNAEPDAMKFKDAIKEVENGRVEFLIGGSMLDPEQVPREKMLNMLRMLAKTKATSVLVETRPEYICDDSLRTMIEILGDKDLEVAIGLETTNDELRILLNKGYTLQDAENAWSRVIKAGGLPVTYLLLGLDMPEEQAVQDFMNSVIELKAMQERLGKNIRIALETFYPVAKHHKRGEYLTPEFVAKMVSRAVEEHGMEFFIATSSEGLCTHPLSPVKELIDEFNATQDVKHLKQILNQ